MKIRRKPLLRFLLLIQNIFRTEYNTREKQKKTYNHNILFNLTGKFLIRENLCFKEGCEIGLVLLCIVTHRFNIFVLFILNRLISWIGKITDS